MSKLRGNKQFKLMADSWLKKQGWKLKNVHNTLIDFKLEEVPYKPSNLIEHDGHQFWVNSFDKEDHFFSKTDGWVTGFDYWKFLVMKEIEHITKIPAGVLIYSESDQEFVFRALRELPKEKIWRASNIKKLPINCVKCEQKKQNVINIKPCVHQLKKTNTKAIWSLDCFMINTSFQITII